MASNGGSGKRDTGHRRIEVARLMAAGHKVQEVADLLGVHRSTIHGDLKDPWVLEQIQAMRTASLESLADVAREASDDALRTLRDALAEEDAVLRIRAAQALLQSLAPLMQQGNLNARMNRLEEASGIRPPADPAAPHPEPETP